MLAEAAELDDVPECAGYGPFCAAAGEGRGYGCVALLAGGCERFLDVFYPTWTWDGVGSPFCTYGLLL